MSIHTTDQEISTPLDQVSSLIIQKLQSVVGAPGMDTALLSSYKAIGALLPYAVRLEKDGRQDMVDVILATAGASQSVFAWDHIRTYINTLFHESSPLSLNRVIVLIPSYFPWCIGFPTEKAVIRWAAAVSLVAHSKEVAQSVVDTLLWISDDDSLRPLIPAKVWEWFKTCPSLPPTRWGRTAGSLSKVVLHVRGLEDIEILKSYLLLVWSEWDCLYSCGVDEMEASIRVEFGGIGMRDHRVHLVEHLDHVQRELDRGLEYFKQHQPRIEEADIRKRKGQYEHLKKVILEVDKVAM